MNSIKTFWLSMLLIIALFTAIIFFEYTNEELGTTSILATSALFIPTINIPISWYFKYIKQNRPLISIFKMTDHIKGSDIQKRSGNLGTLIPDVKATPSAEYTLFTIVFSGLEKGISNLYINYGDTTKKLGNAHNGEYIICVKNSYKTEHSKLNIAGTIQPTGEKFIINQSDDMSEIDIKYLSRWWYKKKVKKYGNHTTKWFTLHKK